MCVCRKKSLLWYNFFRFVMSNVYMRQIFASENCKILYMAISMIEWRYNLLRNLIRYTSGKLLDYLPFCREQDIVFTKLPWGESNTECGKSVRERREDTEGGRLEDGQRGIKRFFGIRRWCAVAPFSPWVNYIPGKPYRIILTPRRGFV